ncbi:MAG TPA: general stress protein [Bryobacteraceae bacterium]|nr:general stress protein [Bryobacteraceae bacterium]
MAHTAVYGIYSTRQDAEMAIDSMRAAGFRAEDISVLFPDNEGTKDIGHEKHTKAPEKATAGAAIAGIAGGALGWLAGIGALAIPGLGPFIAAGPIMAALAGVGAGSVVGGLAGALVGAGIPEYEAKRYEGRIRKGGILLSVHCDDNLMIGRAKEMLRHTGAQDIAAAEEGHVTNRNRREPIAEDASLPDTRRADRSDDGL